MKVYKGRRLNPEERSLSEVLVEVQDDDVTYELKPDESLKVRDHSPAGFEWGYGGSGPAQLALAILLDLLDDTSRAESMYQQFKSWHVAYWGDQWEITGEAIDAFLDQEEPF